MLLIFFKIITKQKPLSQIKTNSYLISYRYCAVSSITCAIVIICKWVALCALYRSPDARNRCRQ